MTSWPAACHLLARRLGTQEFTTAMASKGPSIRECVAAAPDGRTLSAHDDAWPLLAMAVGKFLGAEVAAPRGGRAAGQLVIACALGLYFTPAIAGEVAAHWYLLGCGGRARDPARLCERLVPHAQRRTRCDHCAFRQRSRRRGGNDDPGERHGARFRPRGPRAGLAGFIVVLIVPFVFTGLGLHGADAYQPAQFAVDVPAWSRCSAWPR